MSVSLISLGTCAQDVVNVNNVNVNGDVLSPAVSTATYTLKSNGDVVKTEDITTTVVGQWLTPPFSMEAYEARMTVNSGTTPSGSGTGSYLPLNSQRAWTLTRSGVGQVTCNLTLSIRRIADATVMDTATITLTALVEPGG